MKANSGQAVWHRVSHGGLNMRRKDIIKIVSVTRNKDDLVLQKLITEKISKIINLEYNKS
jgi:hypothetical protein